ncbi:hypothetical protein SLA2020_504310 [Shorea laevis]
MLPGPTRITAVVVLYRGSACELMGRNLGCGLVGHNGKQKMTKPNDLAAQPCHVFSITKDFLPSSSSAMEEEVEVWRHGGVVGEHGGIRRV